MRTAPRARYASRLGWRNHHRRGLRDVGEHGTVFDRRRRYVRPAPAAGARGAHPGDGRDRLSRLGQDDADPRAAAASRGRQHGRGHQRIRRGRHRQRAAAGVERRDGAARQWLPVLHGAHRFAGKPAGAVRRPGAGRGAELRAGHHRNQRPRRSRPGIADLRERPGARRGVSPPVAGHGGRCAEWRGEPRPDARGAASGGAGRPDRAEQDRHRRPGRDRAADRAASGIERGADHGRLARRDRARVSARRGSRPGGAARGAASPARPRARPFARDRQSSRCSSMRRCPGRCSSRSWPC